MNEDFQYIGQDYDEEDYGFDNSGFNNQDDDRFDFTNDDLKLGFIRFIGTESGGINVYEFMFTISQDEFWGEGFNVVPCGICNYLEPDSKYVDKIVKVRMNQNLDLVQNNGCFSMQDCMDGIVSLGWQSLIGLDEYPEYRLVFYFGESYNKVEDKLARCHILMGI